MPRALRPIQEDAMRGLRELVADGHSRALLVAPCGFGKTVIIAAATQGHLDLVPGARVLILVHRRELVKQTADELRAAGITGVGVLDADTSEEPDSKVIVASIYTLISRGIRPRATMVVFDEAHHCPAFSFQTIYASYPDALILGVTATPERGDGKPLGDMFTGMHVGASVKQLTAAGHLTPYEVLAVSEPLAEGIAMSPLRAYAKYTPRRAAVVFCTSVAHAREVAEEFNIAGIRAACVTGDTEDDLRDGALDDFREGRIDVLTNCFVLTEGFDAPRADVCILARRPEHVGTYLQMTGRIGRVAPGKQIATVVDLCGSVYTHGLPDESRRWSLTGTACIRTEKITALKRCRECLAVFRPARICPRCGAISEVLERIPRVLKRAEKLERVNDLPPEEREARMLRGLASRLKKVPKHASKSWDELLRVAAFIRSKERRSA